tara:strand:+ start:88 stop:678 length:591 start_codon:yes stop_codon:yes gene_type:complete
MSTLKATNLVHPSSSSNNIVLDNTGKVSIAEKKLYCPGTIIQVIQGVYTSATSNNLASGSWWDTSSHLSAAITPTATSSKILVRGMVHLAVASPTQSVNVKIMRGGSDTAALGDASGSRTRATTAHYIDNTQTITPLYPEYLDSPSSTSSLTYSFDVKHGSASTRYIYLNRTENNTDDQEYMRVISTITLMEVAGS